MYSAIVYKKNGRFRRAPTKVHTPRTESNATNSLESLAEASGRTEKESCRTERTPLTHSEDVPIAFLALKFAFLPIRKGTAFPYCHVYILLNGHIFYCYIWIADLTSMYNLVCLFKIQCQTMPSTIYTYLALATAPPHPFSLTLFIGIAFGGSASCMLTHFKWSAPNHLNSKQCPHILRFNYGLCLSTTPHQKKRIH